MVVLLQVLVAGSQRPWELLFTEFWLGPVVVALDIYMLVVAVEPLEQMILPNMAVV